MNNDVFKTSGQKISANCMALMLFSLTLTACGSGSDDADPVSDAQNVAATENGTQGDSDAGTDAGMDSGMNDQNGTNTDAGGDNGTDTQSETGNTETTPVVPGGNVAFAGTVTLEKSGQFASAGFNSTNQAVSAQQVQNGIVSSVDSCVVSDSTAVTDSSQPGGIEYNPVSAGDVITLTSPAGSYAELVKSEANGFIFYGVAGDGSLPGPVPSGTVLDIPGDVFPAFPNVAVPDIAELTNVASSTGNTLTANSTVTWDAATSAGSFMNLSAAYTPPGSETSISVFCTVADDGSFSFPADTAAQMGSDFESLNFNLSRSGSTVVQNGNALLTVTVLSSSL